MFDLDGGIGLPDVILVDDEVVAPQIRYEVAVQILHQQLQSHNIRGRIEMYLRSLFACWPMNNEVDGRSGIRFCPFVAACGGGSFDVRVGR